MKLNVGNESRVDVGWYNRTGNKGWLCLVIAREIRFDIARVTVSVEPMLICLG